MNLKNNTKNKFKIFIVLTISLIVLGLSSCSYFKSKNDSPVKTSAFSPPNNKDLLKYEFIKTLEKENTQNNLNSEKIEKAIKDSHSNEEIPKNVLWWGKSILINTVNKTNLIQDSNETTSPHRCDLIKDLANEKDFPLYHLYQLKYYDLCTNESYTHQQSDEKENFLYKKLIKKLNLKKSLNENNFKDKIIFSLDLLEFEKNRNIKKRILLGLKSEAESTKDPALSNLISSQLKKDFPQFHEDQFIYFFDKAMDFQKDRDFQQSKKYLKWILTSKQSNYFDIYKAYKALYKLSKTTQDKKEQIRILKDQLNWILKNKKRNSKLFYPWEIETVVTKARWLWTEDHVNEAIQLLKTTEIQFHKLKSKIDLANDSILEELYYTLGRIFDEKKDYTTSKNYYLKSYQSIKNSTKKNFFSAISEKNLWNLAWLEYKNKDYLDSQNHLELLISLLQEQFLLPENIKQNKKVDSKYYYWLAKNYLLQNKNDNYRSTIKNLKTRDPLSFYSLLAYRDLKDKINLIKPSTNESEMNFLIESLKKVLTPQDILEVQWALATEENDLIQNWAKYLQKIEPENYYLPLLLFSHGQLYSNLLTSINLLSDSEKVELLNHYPELLFPSPYFEDVKKYSESRNIPASLVYSLIRQESAFDPMARSSVDALGLTQLMPSLAKKLAKEENIKFEEFDLFIPEISIRLGSLELKKLLQINKGKIIATVANYNASSAAYNGWMKYRYRKDPIEFIEEIPYEETRAYIKLIIRNIIFYDRIYFQKEEFLFPDQLLKIE